MSEQAAAIDWWGPVAPVTAVTPRAVNVGTVSTAAPEIALRSRIRAAAVDKVLVTALLWAIVIPAAGPQSAPLVAVLTLPVLMAYHFLLELGGGQTPGKRRLGIRVIDARGGSASAGQIALRNLLLPLDLFPLLAASGLLSLWRTGPTRRQRIGDVAAGTLVVPTPGRSKHFRPTPARNLLPVAATAALLVSAAFWYGLYQRSQTAVSPASGPLQARFVADCARGGMKPIACDCLFVQLRDANGVRTEAQFASLAVELRRAEVAHNPRLVPPRVLATVRTCVAAYG